MKAEAFAGRLFADATASLELANIYIGERLGMYRALAERGPLSVAELATATDTHERYVAEWLAAQTVCGITEAVNGSYRLPPEHAEALCNRESPAYLMPMATMQATSAPLMRDLLHAFRTGGGVGYEHLGAEFREAQQDLTRPLFVHGLGPWIEMLGIDPPARVIDVGCGAGIAAVELAKRFPDARVEGIDLDEASIDLARDNARAAGVDVRFHVRDAADPGLDGTYDVITMFDSLHHLARPVEALRERLAGTLLIAEHRADGEFERFVHLVSVVHCLPVAMAEQPSAALGAVMTPETVSALASAAGFAHVEVAAIKHELLRFFVVR